MTTTDTDTVQVAPEAPVKDEVKMVKLRVLPPLRVRRTCLNFPGLQMTIPTHTIKRVEWNRPDGWNDKINHVMLVQDSGEAFAIEDPRDIRLLRQFYNYCYDSHGEICAG